MSYAAQPDDLLVKHEAFFTPRVVIDAILPNLRAEEVIASGSNILEPAAGSGAMLRALIDHGATREQLTAVEIRKEPIAGLLELAGQVVYGDFLQVAPQLQMAGRYFPLIITNPPFSLMQAFAEAALPLLSPGGQLALFGRLGFLSSQRRYRFHLAHPCDVHVLSSRPSFIQSGKTDFSEYAFYVWTGGCTLPGRVFHLPPAK